MCWQTHSQVLVYILRYFQGIPALSCNHCEQHNRSCQCELVLWRRRFSRKESIQVYVYFLRKIVSSYQLLGFEQLLCYTARLESYWLMVLPKCNKEAMLINTNTFYK